MKLENVKGFAQNYICNLRFDFTYILERYTIQPSEF